MHALFRRVCQDTMAHQVEGLEWRYSANTRIGTARTLCRSKLDLVRSPPTKISCTWALALIVCSPRVLLGICSVQPFDP